MPGVKVPSLQHLARVYDNKPEIIKKNLLRVADGTPIFSYGPIYPFINDYISIGADYNEILKAIARLKSDLARKNYAEIFPLIKEKYSTGMPKFVLTPPSSAYPVSRDILVPFAPAMYYRIGSKQCLPWFIFWRANPLVGESFSLLATLAREMMDSDPDLSAASLEFVDFSAPRKNGSRVLKTFQTKDFSGISNRRKIEMLEIFSEGYYLAVEEYASRPVKAKPRREALNPTEEKSIEPDLFYSLAGS
jgi:hypothetical protein